MMGSSISHNGYIYANANPVRYTDPSGEFACLGLCFAAAVLVGGTVIGGVTAATWNVTTEQGVGLGGHNQFDFGAVNWQYTKDRARLGTNIGMVTSSFFAGGIAGRAASQAGLRGWQAFKFLAPYNAVDVGWGIGVDRAINGDSWGQAALWNGVGFGLGEVAGFGLERYIERPLNHLGHKFVNSRFTNRFIYPVTDRLDALRGRYFSQTIFDMNNSPIGEFDMIDFRKGTLFENKDAERLYLVPPGRPGPQQTPAQWAERQIYDKTETRIRNLSRAVSVGQNKANQGIFTNLSRIRSTNHFHFRMRQGDHALQAAVQTQLKRLVGDFPGYKFTASFNHRWLRN